MRPFAAARHAGLALAGCLSMLPAVAQQRSLIPITSSLEDHRGALLSPEGDHVAFRGTDKIGVVPYAGGQETAVANGSNLGSFLWAPDSGGLYYLAGVELHYVQRNGGGRRLVATLPEVSHALWAVKRDGSDLFGTWLYVRTSGSQTVRETQVFALATDGNSAPRVLVRSVVVVDGVRLSPDQTRMVYREYDPTPFSRRDYLVADIDGSNAVSLTGSAGLGINPDLPWWLPDGSGICYARIDQPTSRAVVERLLLTSPTPYSLTFPLPARNPSMSADGAWIAYEGWWQPGSTWTPVVVPPAGGGHVFLDTSRPLVFAGTPGLGGQNGDRLILSGKVAAAEFAQVHKVELARELRITPRADVGGTITVELPVSAGEAGVAFLAAAALPSALPIAGLAGGVQLEPTTLVMVLSGVGSGQGPLRVQVPIPSVPWLRQRAVFLQGVRLTSPAPSGDCTHLVELPLF